eukprot:SM000001S04680  [mRNA]  locus=s1:1608495:1609945:- [translate_table: standard]
MEALKAAGPQEQRGGGFRNMLLVANHGTEDRDAGMQPEAQGRPGYVSFYSNSTNGGDDAAQSSSAPVDGPQKASWQWILGPLALTLSVVLPPVVVRSLLEVVFKDSMLTDFLALFLTDAAFIAGAMYYFNLADTIGYHKITPLATAAWRPPWTKTGLPPGFQAWANTVLLLGVLLPVAVILAVSPFGTAAVAAAAVGPYMLVLAAQIFFEKRELDAQSPMWPAVPIVFQVYRLHQLNRGAQIVAGLIASIATPEPTAQVLAAAGSLGWVLTVLQVLGLVWVTNLGIVLALLPWTYTSWGSQAR